MGLKADLQEVAMVWRRSPWRIKTFLALSAFLASGSIASLSDTVFRWKGFALDAILFYQLYISEPIRNLLQVIFVNTKVSAGAIHLVILSSVYLSANVRVASFAVPAARCRSVASSAISSYLGSIIALIIGVFYSRLELSGEVATSVFAASALCASIPYWRIGGAARILWFTNLLFPFVLVGLIAAIMGGLMRTN
jgi:hypothetical protein